MKKYFILLYCLFALQTAWAQSRQAVYLKNGSVINGKVVVTEEKVTITTKDGSIWVFSTAEVERIDSPIKPNYQKKKGFLNMTSLGVLMGRSFDEWGGTAGATSIRSFTGYQFNPKLALGLGVGLEGYSEITLIPFTLGLRGDLFKSSTTLYYGLDFGYSVALSRRFNDASYQGGVVINPMIGLKLYGPKSHGFFVQLGWNYQKASAERLDWWGGGMSHYEYGFKRMQIACGLFF